HSGQPLPQSLPQPVQLYAGDKPAPAAPDGRPAFRLTCANKTTNFKLRAISFYSSKAASVHSVDPRTDAPYGDVSITLQKKDLGGNWVAATDLEATRTLVDFEPAYAYEVIGGWIDIPTALKEGTTDQWFLSCVGLPDIPQVAVDFVSEVNLEA